MQEKAAKWYIDNKGWNEGRIKHEINEFVSYWTWQKKVKKVNWQSEKGFDVCRRLGRWLWKAEQQGKARHEKCRSLPEMVQRYDARNVNE